MLAEQSFGNIYANRAIKGGAVYVRSEKHQVCVLAESAAVEVVEQNFYVSTISIFAEVLGSKVLLNRAVTPANVVPVNN